MAEDNKGNDAGAGGEKPWFDTFDTETKGYLANKGLDKKTAAEAFVEVSKFHREAEKIIGAPASEIVRLPKDPVAPEWEKVYQRLGKPVDKKDYDLSSVKRAGDKPVEEALVDTIREAAWNANLNKESATRMANDIIKHLDSVENATVALKTDKLNVEKAELKKNWGSNEAANMVVAQGAVRALGVDPSAVSALEGQIGYAKVMEMFRNIGSKIGEDRFVNSNSPGGGSVMTKDQAVSEKAELMRDDAWKTRYLKGGVEEGRKMLALNRIITGTA